MYVEMTLAQAEKYLKKSKNKKVLVSVQNLGEDSIQEFSPRLKEECLEIMRQAETLARCCGEIVDSLNAFSVKQNIRHIKKEGQLATILLDTVKKD